MLVGPNCCFNAALLMQSNPEVKPANRFLGLELQSSAYQALR